MGCPGESSPEECVFCLDSIACSPTVQFVCHHIVHTKCFLEYVKYQMTNAENVVCPMCRDELLEKAITGSQQPLATIRAPDHTSNVAWFISVLTAVLVITALLSSLAMNIRHCGI